MLGEIELLSPKYLYRNYNPPDISKAPGRISPFKLTALAKLAYKQAHKNAQKALLKLVTNFRSLLNAKSILRLTNRKVSCIISC